MPATASRFSRGNSFIVRMNAASTRHTEFVTMSGQSARSTPYVTHSANAHTVHVYAARERSLVSRVFTTRTACGTYATIDAAAARVPTTVTASIAIPEGVATSMPALVSALTAVTTVDADAHSSVVRIGAARDNAHMSSRRHAAVLLTAAAGCGFNPSGEGAPNDGTPPPDDSGNITVTLRYDSVADFTMPGTTAEDLVVEPWGALAPAAYQAGALIAHGSNSQRFNEADEAVWDEIVSSAAPAGTGFMTRPLSGDPPGVGLDSGDTWTYWAEGEIWLDAGPTTFVVDCDDQCFIEAAPEAGGDYVRVVNGRFGVGTGTFTAEATGWHPIRLAAQEGFGASRFDIQLFPGNATTGELLSPARLRARVDGMRGTVLAGWDNALLVGAPTRSLATAELVNADFGGNTPRDLGIGSGDQWSVRWAGQFYVTIDGAYQLRVQSDDGQRLYVNGEVVTDVLDGTTADNTVEVELKAGWNDLALDLNELTGNASARLRVTGGPEPGLDRELPASRLRPLEPRGRRIETAGEDDDVGIPDDPSSPGATSTVKIGGLTGATVASVDVVVGINHGRFADLEVRLVHPGGNEVVLRDNSDAGGNGNRFLRFSTDAFVDTPAAGDWRVRVNDTVAGTGGSITDLQLAVHMRNGPDQVARDASFTSLVRDLGNVVSIDQVRFAGRSPSGEGVAIRLRGCDAPEQCAAAPWSAPITESGSPAGIDVKRYIQYRVELTSDGEREPELDWVEIDYRVPPG
jgi:subtilisin-like proprotein convertase family protein